MGKRNLSLGEEVDIFLVGISFDDLTLFIEIFLIVRGFRLRSKIPPFIKGGTKGDSNLA